LSRTLVTQRQTFATNSTESKMVKSGLASATYRSSIKLNLARNLSSTRFRKMNKKATPKISFKLGRREQRKRRKSR
jgi:hypothetical protein